MPYVFMVFFGYIVCRAPKWRLTAFVIFMSSVMNVVLMDFYRYVSDLLSPLLAVFTFYALIDFLTIYILKTIRPCTIRGYFCGVNGALGQVKVLWFFIFLSFISYVDYVVEENFLQSGDYMLKSTFIPAVLLLNIAQMLIMGLNYGSRTDKRTKVVGSFFSRNHLQPSHFCGSPAHRIHVDKEVAS